MIGQTVRKLQLSQEQRLDPMQTPSIEQNSTSIKKLEKYNQLVKLSKMHLKTINRQYEWENKLIIAMPFTRMRTCWRTKKAISIMLQQEFNRKIDSFEISRRRQERQAGLFCPPGRSPPPARVNTYIFLVMDLRFYGLGGFNIEFYGSVNNPSTKLQYEPIRCVVSVIS